MSTDLKNLASDVQERFRDLIYHMPDVIDAAKLMVGSSLLSPLSSWSACL